MTARTLDFANVCPARLNTHRKWRLSSISNLYSAHARKGIVPTSYRPTKQQDALGASVSRRLGYIGIVGVRALGVPPSLNLSPRVVVR